MLLYNFSVKLVDQVAVLCSLKSVLLKTGLHPYFKFQEFCIFFNILITLNVIEIMISVKMHLCTFILLSLALAFGPASSMVS